MVKFFELFVSFAIIGLAIFSIFQFGIDLQSESNVTDKFIDNTVINTVYVDLGSNLGNLRENATKQKQLFESESPTSGFGSILLFSILSAGKVFNGMIIGIFNIIIVLPATFLGVNEIVISVIATILILAIILGLWSVYKLGG